LVLTRLSIVAEADVKSEIVPVDEVSDEIVPEATERSVIVVVASTDVPVAVKVPVTRFDVVAFVAVKESINPVRAWK